MRLKRIRTEKARREFLKSPAPGAYQYIPADDYHSANALNNSSLKRILISPAHFRVRQPDSANLMFGRLYHELTFTPRQFRENWAVWKGGRRYGKDWDAFHAASNGKDLCTEKEWSDAKELARAVRQCDIGRQYAKGTGQNELSLIWNEEVDGMPLTLKCRIDRLAIDNQPGQPLAAVDLKGTTASNKDEFAREAARYHYEMQAAFYLRGVENVFNVTMTHEDFIFIAVEKSTQIVSAYWLPEDALHFGRQKVDHALRRYVQCVRENHWPAPNNGRAEELTSYFPKEFEGMEIVNMDGLEVEPMEDAA